MFCPQARAAVEYCQVIETEGTAEILRSGSVQWLPLSAPRLLKAGDRVRTVGKSNAEFSSSPGFSGLSRLGANSELEVMGEDLARFFLHRGEMFALREEDSNVPGRHRREETLFQIFTKDGSFGFLQGGCSVSVSERGAWARIFSEHVKLTVFGPRITKGSAKMLFEGYKYFISRSQNESSPPPIRMHYSDYFDWQSWIKKCDMRKDLRAIEFLAGKTG